MDLIFSPAVMDIVKELEEDFKDNGKQTLSQIIVIGYYIVLF